MTRAGLYTRVSSAAQVDTYSLPAQRRALHEMCAARGYEIAIEATDEGISARSERIETRPGLVSLLAEVDAGRLDVVAVHSLDRLSRNVMVTLQVFKRLAARDVGFISLSEAISYETPEGRLQLTILGAFDEYFSDLLAKHVAKGKGERVAQGLHNNRLPLGYTKDAAGAIIHDPATVDAVREMWRLASLGQTDHQVAKALAALGLSLSRDTVRYLLRNRFFLGEVCYRGKWFPGKHPALIDEATWQTVQAHRIANRRTGCGKREHSTPAIYTLGGLLTCARCGSHLQGNDGGRNYICWGRRALSCTQPMATDRALSEQFGELLSSLAIPDAQIGELVAEQPARPAVNREAIERQLERLRKQYRWGHIDEDEYTREYGALEAELQQEDTTPSLDHLAGMVARLRSLAGLWASVQPEERKALASSLVSDLLVDDRRLVAVRFHAPLLPICRLIWQPDGDHAGYVRL